MIRAEFYHRIPRLIQKAELVPYSCLHGVQKNFYPGIEVNAALKQVELDSFILFRLVKKHLKFIHY